LNRFDRDALARAILRGSIPESSKLRRMAVDLRPLFAPLLEAAGLKAPLQDRHFVRRRKYRLESVYSREFLNDIADRIRRLLPSFVKEGSL
jgi:hypothetical protein